jgi:hypothetical protein
MRRDWLTSRGDHMKISFTVSAVAIGLLGVLAASTLSGRAAVEEQAAPGITSHAQQIAFTPANAAWEQCRLGRAAYDRLSTGMGYAMAERTLGCPGREMSRQEISGRFGLSSVSYEWRGVGSAMITASFQNNSLTSKNGFGL